MNWIYELSSLQDIAIECNYCDFNLLMRLTNLTNLTKLFLKGDLFTCINLDIEWHHLQALQCLSIGEFYCGMWSTFCQPFAAGTADTCLF